MASIIHQLLLLAPPIHKQHSPKVKAPAVCKTSPAAKKATAASASVSLAHWKLLQGPVSTEPTLWTCPANVCFRAESPLASTSGQKKK